MVALLTDFTIFVISIEGMTDLPPTLGHTSFQFPGQTHRYQGKVRDVYTLGNRLVMIASDRISAFDHVLRQGIPFKGQVLNQTATYFLEATKDICPNWLEATPDPNVSIGLACEPYRVEMVIRAYLVGHAWRVYRAGKRSICGVPMPEGMQENDRFPEPIITPATKAESGHDEDISREEIIRQGLVPAAAYQQLEDYTRALFARGTEMAAQRGLLLVDTKYEFGRRDGTVYLIDEIHTPDSSRYFYADGYEERQARGERQQQLSKEFVREWLMEQGFQGKSGQEVPDLPPAFVQAVSKRYIELYEGVTGTTFTPAPTEQLDRRIETNIRRWLQEND